MKSSRTCLAACALASLMVVALRAQQALTGPAAPPWFSDVFPTEEIRDAACRRHAADWRRRRHPSGRGGEAGGGAVPPEQSVLLSDRREVPRAFVVLDGRTRRPTSICPTPAAGADVGTDCWTRRGRGARSPASTASCRVSSWKRRSRRSARFTRRSTRHSGPKCWAADRPAMPRGFARANAAGPVGWPPVARTGVHRTR